ncbi:MAG: hypothetical protein RL885_31890 [Planctomycetota bacterium]
MSFIPIGWTLALLTGTALASDLPPEVEDRVEKTLHTSEALWESHLPKLREDMAAFPKEIIAHLVGRLEDPTPVYGRRDESQIYSVCGNALSLLESLTDLRLDAESRDWIGFSTHDHRGAQPSPATITGPWKAFLEIHRDRPVRDWLWGLEYEELSLLIDTLRMPAEDWTDERIDSIRRLDRRAFPYLLDRLLLDDVAHGDARYCDQANLLLARLTSREALDLAKHELLRYDKEDLMRKGRLAVILNRQSMQTAHRLWMTRILTER